MEYQELIFITLVLLSFGHTHSPSLIDVSARSDVLSCICCCILEMKAISSANSKSSSCCVLEMRTISSEI
jgi:hypothetical protein